MGKKRTDAEARFDSTAHYTPVEALGLVKAVATAGFDETVEAAFYLGIDARQADQAVRGTVSLPHGTGKVVRVLVFADGERAREASQAGADIVGASELAEAITSGRQPLDWDVTIAVPSLMSEVGKLGRVLGPRGLMPNPKVGTVTADLAKAIRDAKGGKVEFRAEKAGIVHAPVGKASFPAEKLTENFNALMELVMKLKPSSAKGVYLKGATISATMTPGIKLDVQEIGARHK